MKSKTRFLSLFGISASIGVLYHHYYNRRKERKRILFYYNKNIKEHIKDMKYFQSLPFDTVDRKYIHRDDLMKKPLITLINNNSIKEINNANKEYYNLLSKLQCFFIIKQIDDYISLREEFRWLEHPKHRIVLISKEAYDSIDHKVLSKYFLMNTKVIIVSNEKFINSLDIKTKNAFYVYYPPKLPYALATPEFVDSSLSPYFYLNPMSLLLKHKLFRDEYVVNNNIAYIKTLGVLKHAETFHSNIKENLKRKGHHLFIYLPHWDHVDDGLITKILLDYRPMFHSVNITTSSSFAKRLDLYEQNTLLSNVPQIFAISNNDGMKESHRYNLGYFNFKERMDLLYQGKCPVYIPQKKLLDMKSDVINVTSADFKKRIINDKSFSECIIEISKEDCPACFILEKMFDHLSLKLKKHDIDKLKLFRVDAENDLPFLGEFNATPTFVFCRKGFNGNIEFICQLTKDNFISKLKEVSKLDLSKIAYHNNLANGYLLYMNRTFENDKIDADCDIITKH